MQVVSLIIHWLRTLAVGSGGEPKLWPPYLSSPHMYLYRVDVSSCMFLLALQKLENRMQRPVPAVNTIAAYGRQRHSETN